MVAIEIPANTRYVLFLCTPDGNEQMKVEHRYDETTTNAIAAAELVNLGSGELMRAANEQMRQVARMHLVQPLPQPEYVTVEEAIATAAKDTPSVEPEKTPAKNWKGAVPPAQE